MELKVTGIRGYPKKSCPENYVKLCKKGDNKFLKKQGFCSFGSLLINSNFQVQGLEVKAHNLQPFFGKFFRSICI